jgi:hypothetical protein
MVPGVPAYSSPTPTPAAGKEPSPATKYPCLSIDKWSRCAVQPARRVRSHDIKVVLDHVQIACGRLVLFHPYSPYPSRANAPGGVDGQ